MVAAGTVDISARRMAAAGTVEISARRKGAAGTVGFAARRLVAAAMAANWAGWPVASALAAIWAGSTECAAAALIAGRRRVGADDGGRHGGQGRDDDDDHPVESTRRGVHGSGSSVGARGRARRPLRAAPVVIGHPRGSLYVWRRVGERFDETNSDLERRLFSGLRKNDLYPSRVRSMSTDRNMEISTRTMDGVQIGGSRPTASAAPTLGFVAQMHESLIDIMA